MAMPSVRPTVAEIHDVALALEPPFAGAISRWEIEVGEDHRGEPGIFVTIVFKDSEIHEAWKIRTPFRQQLERRLIELYPDYFPYITFSSESIAINPERPATR